MGADETRNRTPVSSLLATVSAVCTHASLESGTHGASVSLTGEAHVLSPVWASDATAERLEELQITLGEGPCLDAVATGAPVLVEDFAVGREDAWPWPAFGQDVADLGVRGLFAFPVEIGAVSLGSLEFYRREAGGLSSPQLSVALNAAEVVGGVLLALSADSGGNDIIPGYRLVVHQAAGMITVQLDVAIGEAMSRLRARAYSQGRPINEVAAEVVAGTLRLVEEAP
jgi:hypothetical protein